MQEQNAMDIGMMPNPPKKKQGFFSSKPKEEQSQNLGFTNEINSMSRRLRLLEETSTNVRNMLQITEENMISKHRTFDTEIKALTSEMNEVKKELNELKDKILLIVNELRSSARKEDVKLIEKYITMWNPVKFVTKGELDYVVREAIENYTKESNKTKKENV